MTCSTRDEFLKKLFLMYPANFNEKNAPIWKNAYETCLPENLDFNKLFFLMVKNYKSIATAPAPSWFEDYKDECKPTKKNKALEQIKLLKNTEGCPPPPAFYEAQKRLKLSLVEDKKLQRKVDSMSYIHD